MEQLQTSYETFDTYKQAVDTELGKATESFVRIGYLLKLARDTDILKGHYESVNDFAMKEYGLEKTQVSRFMSINDRFSVGGNSAELIEEYKGFGSSKLAIMLQLPDSINEVITPDYSKAEITAIKNEADKEKERTDIEVILEDKPVAFDELDTILEKTIYILGKEETEKYKDIWKALKMNVSENDVAEILAPSGLASYSIRVPGTGRMLMTIKESEEDISIASLRTGEKFLFSRYDLKKACGRICLPTDTAENSFETIYQEKIASTEEVAPEQPQKKESKVIIPEEKKKEEPVKEKKVELPKKEMEQPVEQLDEENLPGQKNMEDYPETLPDGYMNHPQEPEKVEAEIVEKVTAYEAEEMKMKLQNLGKEFESGHFNTALMHVSEIEFMIKKKMEEHV